MHDLCCTSLCAAKNVMSCNNVNVVMPCPKMAAVPGGACFRTERTKARVGPKISARSKKVIIISTHAQAMVVRTLSL